MLSEDRSESNEIHVSEGFLLIAKGPVIQYAITQWYRTRGGFLDAFVVEFLRIALVR